MEFLQEILGDQLYAQVAEKLKGNDKVKLANLASGEYISKNKYDEETQKSKTLGEQLAERDKQFKELEPLTAGNAALTDELKKLQEANKQATVEYETKLNQVRFDNALELRLRDSKARNVKAAKALLELDKLKLDGDNLTGFDEQITAVKEQNGYLFEDPVPAGAGGAPGAVNPPPAAEFDFGGFAAVNGVKPTTK